MDYEKENEIVDLLLQIRYKLDEIEQLIHDGPDLDARLDGVYDSD